MATLDTGYTVSEQAKIDAAEIIAKRNDVATSMRQAFSYAERISARSRAAYTQELIAHIARSFDRRLNALTDAHVASFSHRV